MRASIGAFSDLPLRDGENADTFAATSQAGQSVVYGGLSFCAYPSRLPHKQLSELTGHDDKPSRATKTSRPLDAKKLYGKLSICTMIPKLAIFKITLARPVQPKTYRH